MADVSIVAPRPAWAQEFVAVAAELRALTADTVTGIFHVGSTSAPGLPAKDVIDGQVSVPAGGLIDRTLSASAAGGFGRSPAERPCPGGR